MTIPGFEKFVPLNEFKSLLRDYIEIDDSICRGKLKRKKNAGYAENSLKITLYIV